MKKCQDGYEKNKNLLEEVVACPSDDALMRSSCPHVIWDAGDSLPHCCTCQQGGSLLPPNYKNRAVYYPHWQDHPHAFATPEDSSDTAWPFNPFVSFGLREYDCYVDNRHSETSKPFESFSWPCGASPDCLQKHFLLFWRVKGGSVLCAITVPNVLTRNRMSTYPINSAHLNHG
eukprot:6479749-Amphidinium_carterae.1